MSNCCVRAAVTFPKSAGAPFLPTLRAHYPHDDLPKRAALLLQSSSLLFIRAGDFFFLSNGSVSVIVMYTAAL